MPDLMKILGPCHSAVTRLLCVGLACCLGACITHPATRNSVAALGVGLLAQTPSSSLEQVYYLGVFDPQEQLPPTVYRVRVRGQGSALSTTRYASGWVRSEFIDSLSTVAKFGNKDLDSGVSLVPASEEDKVQLITGRRLILCRDSGAIKCAGSVGRRNLCRHARATLAVRRHARLQWPARVHLRHSGCLRALAAPLPIYTATARISRPLRGHAED